MPGHRTTHRTHGNDASFARGGFAGLRVRRRSAGSAAARDRGVQHLGRNVAPARPGFGAGTAWYAGLAVLLCGMTGASLHAQPSADAWPPLLPATGATLDLPGTFSLPLPGPDPGGTPAIVSEPSPFTSSTFGPASPAAAPVTAAPTEPVSAHAVPGAMPPGVSAAGEAGPAVAAPAAEEWIGDPGAWWLPFGWQEWFLARCWSGNLEIGINSTEGNAEAFSSRFGGNLKRKSQYWEWKVDATYAKSTANGNETQHNAIFNSGFERMFGESSWSYFGKLNLEYDEFKAFDLRLVMNMGMGYQLLKTDTSLLKARFGAGTSHEINSPDHRWVPEAVFGMDLNHQLSDRHKLALTSDYFPEWDDFTNYRLVTDASWIVALDDDSKLSLKLSVNERYDSTPNGRKPTDIIYALLLLWQL